MSFDHIEFVVQDLQRMWLHVWGILDYMEIYKPRMDGHAPPGKGVADTIGTFITSIHVAQDMFLTGLPCWLIQESKTFGNEKKDYIVLDPQKFNYPIIYKGPASGLEKFNVIKKFACNFLCSQNPFAITSTPSSLTGASQPSTLSTPAVASSSAAQHSTGQNSQGAIHRSVRGCGADTFNIYLYYKIVTTGSHQSSHNHEHNGFQSIMDLPITPLLIPSWSSALAVVDDDSSCG